MPHFLTETNMVYKTSPLRSLTGDLSVSNVCYPHDTHHCNQFGRVKHFALITIPDTDRQPSQ